MSFDDKEATGGMFYGLSVACLLLGIVFLVSCVVAWPFAWRDFRVLLFGTAMLFAGVANALAFLVFHRMQSAGYSVGWWRTSKDFRLYSEYWRIAPEKGWSRLPMIGFVLSFILAGCTLFSLMFASVGGK